MDHIVTLDSRQEAARIAIAPTVQCGPFEGQDVFTSRLNRGHIAS